MTPLRAVTEIEQDMVALTKIRGLPCKLQGD
jgi:hypothetical protein